MKQKFEWRKAPGLTVPLSIALAFSLGVAGPASADDAFGVVVDRTSSLAFIFDADEDEFVGSVALPAAPLDSLDCSILQDQSLAFVSDFSGFQIHVVDVPNVTLAGGTNPIPVSLLAEDTTISPDQKYLVIADGGASFGLSVVDIAARSELGPLAVPGLEIESVEACSDSSLLATGFFGLLLPSSVHRLTIDGTGTITDTGETHSLPDAFNTACPRGAAPASP